MARGWKCPRCSTQNGEGVMNCSKCGLIHGGVYVPSTYGPPEAQVASRPAASDPAASAPPAAQGVGAPLLIGSEEGQPNAGWVPPYPIAPKPTRPLWRRVPLGLLIFGVLVVGGAVAGFVTNASRSSSGDITKGGDMSSSDLRVGDCWDLKDPSADTVDNVTAKPCTEGHKYEVFFVGPMDGTSYPTEDEFTTYVTNNCLPAFTGYVGTPYESSKLEITWLNPVSQGWAQGDKTVECSVYDPANSRLASSLRSSGR